MPDAPNALPPTLASRKSLLARIEALEAKAAKDTKTIGVLVATRDKLNTAVASQRKQLEVMRKELLNRPASGSHDHAGVTASEEAAQLRRKITATEQELQEVLAKFDAIETDPSNPQAQAATIARLEARIAKQKESIAEWKGKVADLSKRVLTADRTARMEVKVNRRLSAAIRDYQPEQDLVGKLVYFSKSDALTDLEVFVWIDLIMAKREIELLTEALPGLRQNSEAYYLYTLARLALYKGEDYPDFSVIHALLGDSSHHRLVERRIANVMTGLSLRGTRDELKAAAAYHIENDFLSLGRILQVGLLRELDRHGLEAERDALIKPLVDQPLLERLYFVGLFLESPDAFGTILPEYNGANMSFLYGALEQTAEERLTQLSELLNDRLIPAYRSVPQICDFLNVRGSPQERADLEYLVSRALKLKTDFSVVRLGDGESYVFPKDVLGKEFVKSFDEDEELREHVWWGESPTKAQRNGIIKGVNEAIDNATMIGVPGIYRVVRDLPRADMGLDKNRTLRGMASVVAGVSERMASGANLFTEERVHYVLHKTNAFERFAHQAEKVVVVGSWTKEHFEGTFLETAEVIQVPPHQKVKDLNPDSRPLFEKWKGIDKQVAKAVKPGTLVLVGAGVIGKIFIETARKRGGVALDIGAVLDYIAGRRTRGSADI